MFKVRFDFDLEEYQKHLERYQRLGTKPYHFVGLRQSRVREACNVAARLSAIVARSSPLRERLIAKWFGKSTAGVPMNLVRMDSVISDPDRSVLFVDGSKRHVAVKVDRHNLDNPQVLMDTPYGDAKMKYAGAWVHVLPGRGAPRKAEEYHVGSGIRIILGRAYPFRGDKYERAGVVYHELTHKVFGANDHEYGPLDCEALAKRNGARAARNADSYNHFLQEFGKLHDAGVRV